MDISPKPLVFKDRSFTAVELELIGEVVETCPGLSRQELANTVCELLGWKRANGRLKTWECKEFLGELEQAGQLELPVLRVTKPRGARVRIPCSVQAEEGVQLGGSVGDVAPVQIRLVEQASDRLLWRELVDRYHYLGYKMAFGARLQYLVAVERPQVQVVGCVQFSSPAWKMAARDSWIGWSEGGRGRNLQRIVNQSRFLILPWIQVRNLASHVLAQVSRRVAQDWQRCYGIRPLLAETLVDERYRGSCYRAANWKCLGHTSGRGRQDRRHRRHGRCPKRVFVYPLSVDCRESLCRGGGDS